MESAPATAVVEAAIRTMTASPKAPKKPLTAPRISTNPSFNPRKMLRIFSGLIFRSVNRVTRTSSCLNSSMRMSLSASPSGPSLYTFQSDRYFRTP